MKDPLNLVAEELIDKLQQISDRWHKLMFKRKYRLREDLKKKFTGIHQTGQENSQRTKSKLQVAPPRMC